MRLDDFIALMSKGAVRKVVRRSHAGFVGYFPSRKFGRLEYERHLERDFLRLMEVDPAVSFLRHQPCTLFWTDELGNIHEHFPDFALVRHGSPAIIEVKPATETPTFAYRTKALERQLARKGVVYKVVTELFVRREPTLSNAIELLSGIAYEPSPEFTRAVLETLESSTDGLALGEIPDLINVAPDARYALYTLIMDGVVVLVEPDASITPASRIVRAANDRAVPWISA